MSSNGEIIQLHVGQAGVQIANACWELYCLEHGIDAHGYMYHWPSDEAFRTFFACCDTPKLVPRVVMVDSEPTVIDEVRTGAYGQLFKPDSLLNGKEDSGSNFARGYNTLGSELIDITMDSIRSIAEDCPNLKGFIAFRSMGGGTGSGLGDRIMERISDEYGKTTKMDFIIFPSPSISPLIVEPYNSLLGAHVGMDSSDCTFILDNEALYDICARSLDVASPTYTNLNRIIGQAISALTAPQRFYGSMNVSFAEFQTNLVPFPRIHFPLVSYAPLATLCTACYTQLSTEQLTFQCFHPSSQLVRCNPVKGKYMSCVLLYRGNVVPVDINSSIKLMKAKSGIRFVDWCPTGFKIGINSMPPCPVPGGDVGHANRALVALSNSTAIKAAWCRLLSNFGHLYKRRAFVHHFVSEGMEEDMFAEASEDISSLIGDYRAAEEELDTSDRSGSMEGVPWRQQFRTHRDQAHARSLQSCDSERTERSKTGKRVHESYSEHGSYETEIRNTPRFQVSSARLSTSGMEENDDRVSDTQMNEIQVPPKIEGGISDRKLLTISQGGQEREKSFADKIDSPMSLAEKSPSSQMDYHFQIHSEVGSTSRADQPRSQSTEVLKRCSSSDLNFQIRNAVCTVLESIIKSTAATSKGVTTINCFINITQTTCAGTADQLPTEVPIFGCGELSKSYRLRMEKNRLPSMIPIPIAKGRYSASQNCQSKKPGQVDTSGGDGVIPKTERTGRVGDHASLKLQRSSKPETVQRKFNNASSKSKPRRFPRSVRSRKSCQTIPHVKRKIAPILSDRIDLRGIFNKARIHASKPRRFITPLSPTGLSSD